MKPERRKSMGDVVLKPEQVREAAEMAWTDATHLPSSDLQAEVCQHLLNAVAALDQMVEESKSRKGRSRR